MARNDAYLKSDTSTKGDEVYTPYYAVDPLLEFIDKDKVIWCPFDEEWSAFYNLFKEKGYKVIRSSLKDNQDFFEYEPKQYDIIISNPPFSKKDKILKRLYELDKPFMLLLPIQSLQSKARYQYFKNGLELLVFDSRIDYHTREDYKEYRKGNHFASIYFCKDVLPSKLIFRELKKYQRPLKLDGNMQEQLSLGVNMQEQLSLFETLIKCVYCNKHMKEKNKKSTDGYFCDKCYKKYWC